MTNVRIKCTQNPRRHQKTARIAADQERMQIEKKSMKINKIKCFVVVFVVAFILLCFASCALTKPERDDHTIIVVGTET